MKRKSLFLAFSLYFLICGISAASTLEQIRFANYPDRVRVVFDFDAPIKYETDQLKDRIVITLLNVSASSEIQSIVDFQDPFIRYFEIEKIGQNLRATIPLAEPLKYNIFYLVEPPRLVIDFDREFLSVVSAGKLAEGIEHIRIKKGSVDGILYAHALKVDLAKAEVKPSLAKKPEPNILSSFLDFITPWRRDPAREHFFLDTVSRIVEDNHALAGVNGTYFAYTGKPLGALMINQELISGPINGRTALLLDQNNTPYIDQILVSSYFVLEEGIKYKITGINQQQGEAETVLYTPIWGRRTGTDRQGMELVVKNSVVQKINVSDSEIPQDGFVISVRGPAVETLSQKIKANDKIALQVKVIPYTTSPQNIVHLISGGPRLLKHGKIYVSKHEEKFKADIARGRAARTAVAITPQKELLLVTVDGRPNRKNLDPHQKSIGATLEELSRLLQSLGAVEAMNLDGGSSSTMVISKKVVNYPVSGGERKVSNAIVVRPGSNSQTPQNIP